MYLNCSLWLKIYKKKYRKNWERALTKNKLGEKTKALSLLRLIPFIRGYHSRISRTNDLAHILRRMPFLPHPRTESTLTHATPVLGHTHAPTHPHTHPEKTKTTQTELNKHLLDFSKKFQSEIETKKVCQFYHFQVQRVLS